MKRSALKLVLSLLLGAIINIAVACGIALAPHDDIAACKNPELMSCMDSTTTYIWIECGHEQVAQCDGLLKSDGSFYGPTPTYLNDLETLRASIPLWADFKRAYIAGKHRGGDTWNWLVEFASGWPTLAMKGHFATAGNPSRRVWPTLEPGWHCLDDFSHWEAVVRRVPSRPIWPGFAINTVFYSMILWVLFATPFALRRWRRSKRGLCPACGYDLRGSSITSAVCPECGKLAGGQA